LQRGEDEFVRRRIYLTLERGRDIALRNLLRKVFIAGGFDEIRDGETVPVRRTRVPVAEFQAAISMGSGGELMDADEVECLLANMIYKVRVSLSSLSLLKSHRNTPCCHFHACNLLDFSLVAFLVAFLIARPLPGASSTSSNHTPHPHVYSSRVSH
jgi:hypothetical protein